MMFPGDWCHWNEHVGEYIYPTEYVPDYTSILVPNVDNTRTAFLLEIIAKRRKVASLCKEKPMKALLFENLVFNWL